MSTYDEASRFKAQLTRLINEAIENHPLVKMALKGQKAIMWEAPNTTAKTVQVKLLPDVFNPETQPLTLGYNSKVESYLLSATPKQSAVWISYTYSINNAVVDNNGTRSL